MFNSKTVKKNLMIIVGAVLLVGVLAWFGREMIGREYSENKPESVPMLMPAPNSISSSNISVPQDNEASVFQVEASNFKYDVTEIKVKKGDRVKITLNVKEGFHDLVLDEFTVATEKLQAGGTAEVQFTADKEGRFEYYCSVGAHRQMGMVGTLIVE